MTKIQKGLETPQSELCNRIEVQKCSPCTKVFKNFIFVAIRNFWRQKYCFEIRRNRIFLEIYTNECCRQKFLMATTTNFLKSLVHGEHFCTSIRLQNSFWGDFSPFWILVVLGYIEKTGEITFFVIFGFVAKYVRFSLRRGFHATTLSGKVPIDLLGTSRTSVVHSETFLGAIDLPFQIGV